MSTSYHHYLPRLTIAEDSSQSKKEDFRTLTLIWFQGKTKLRGILTHTLTNEGAYRPPLPQLCSYDCSPLSILQIGQNGDTSRYAICSECLCLYQFPSPERLINV
ncbi:MAG: hypothetical protein AABY00_03070 [Nanoarchaeota archaeon]